MPAANRDNANETGGLLDRWMYLINYMFCYRYRFVSSLAKLQCRNTCCYVLDVTRRPGRHESARETQPSMVGCQPGCLEHKMDKMSSTRVLVRGWRNTVGGLAEICLANNKPTVGLRWASAYSYVICVKHRGVRFHQSQHVKLREHYVFPKSPSAGARPWRPSGSRRPSSGSGPRGSRPRSWPRPPGRRGPIGRKGGGMMRLETLIELKCLDLIFPS